MEAFHIVLKRDCRLHPVRALEDVLASVTPMGMRVLWLRDLARVVPDAPATPVVSTDVVQVVALPDRCPQAE